MSAVGPGALVMISDRYLPRPSWAMPLATVMPLAGTSANFTVLLGFVKIASERSLPTLFASMSMAATNSMSLTW